MPINSQAGLRLKTYLLILAMVTFGPIGNVLLSKGMKATGAVTALPMTQYFHVMEVVSASPVIWMGFSSLVLSFTAYLLVLSWADYSFVQPASSISYGMVMLLGHVLLGDVLTLTRVVGVLIISLGVFFVGHTPPCTTESN